jgi:hypothetical protein
MKNLIRFITLLLIIGSTYAQGVQFNASARLTDEQIKSLEGGNTRLNCQLSCAFSFGLSNKKLRQLHDTNNWDELIFEVVNIGFERDLSYYYLGRAFEGKGNLDAAEKYYKLGLATNKCNGNSCSGFQFPDEINKRLVGLQRSTFKPKTEILLPSGWTETLLPTELKNAGAEFIAYNNNIQAALRYWTTDKASVVNVSAYTKRMPQIIASDLNGATFSETQEIEINGNKAYRFEITGSPKNQSTPITFLITFIEGLKYLVRIDALVAAKDYPELKEHFGKLAFNLRSNDLKNLGNITSPAANLYSEQTKLGLEADEAKRTQSIQGNQSLYSHQPPLAPSENRKALIIGNDSYKSVAKLVNAREDARTIASNLTAIGYQVTLKLDLNEKEMKSSIRAFANQVQGGDEVFFFFAGHGVQLGATNYLLPIDIIGESEAQIRDESIQLQRILDDMSDRKAKFTLAMVDACRDNPFKSTGRSIGGRGLAPTTAATGQMVIFSAGAGQQAMDRLNDYDKNKNGLFTRVFVQEMQIPGLSIDRVVKNVRNKVADLAKSVGHEQVPAVYDQVLGDFYFKR